MSRRAAFSVNREPIELELGGEEFEAKPVVAPAVLSDLLTAGDAIGTMFNDKNTSPQDMVEGALKTVDQVFGVILTAESAPRFHERLFSLDNPFDLMHEVMPALQWLVEEYTERPTAPSQPSSNGSGDGTSSSTSGASVEASTPTTSQPAAGATPSTPPSTT